MNEPVITQLLTRRSVKANALADPGPDDGTLELILKAGGRVPDHKKLTPWRFILLQGEARSAFGAKLAEICAARESYASDIRLEAERTRFTRAPLVIVTISSPIDHPACPEWEQVLSAGAVCMNLLHAAVAAGFGAQWLTEWYSFDPDVANAFGLAQHEKFAGFIYIGTAQETPADRGRPDLTQIASRPTIPFEA
ncbi:MAG: nitroreductase [Hyphomicrobiales bacterium]|nr:nitroreductase [Hyphomicrobiales bacterium]